MLPHLLSIGPIDMENEKTSENKGYRDLVWELAGIACKEDGDTLTVVSCVWSLGKASYFFRKLARGMTALLLVWQYTEHLDCTYGQVGIVKHDAGTLGVLWVIHGAPSTLRIAGDDCRHDGETKMGRERQSRHISIVPVHAAGREADDFGGSSALNPTNLSFTIH